MKRIHINLQVNDLDEAVSFYTTLFRSKPTKLKSDYAKWALSDPSVNFSVSRTVGPARLEHLGIEAGSADELAELRERLGRIENLAEDRVYEEGQTTCCYANSDKTWVRDPVDVTWEIFHSHGESQTYHEAESECCDPGKSADEGECCDTNKPTGTAGYALSGCLHLR